MNDLVSIVMPAFNCAGFVNKSIASVQAQTYPHWELIVVDDASKDNTVEVVKKLAEQDERIKLIELSQNQGAAVARNTAIDKAQGRYIAFLDSDDAWLPSKLETQVAHMQEQVSGLSYSAYHVIDENDKRRSTFIPPEQVTYKDLLRTCSIGCLTAMYDTSVIGKVKMPLIRKRQDYGLWLKILKMVPHASGIPIPLAEYRVREESLSGNKFKAAQYQWKIYREVENLSWVKSAFYFFHYAIAGFLKYR